MISRSQQSAGFSLLEVMVVVFLIATIATVGVLKLGTGQNVAMESEAKQMVEKLNLLIDESVITGQTHRIVFEKTKDTQSYSFEKWQNNQWQKVEDQPYRKHAIHPNLGLLFIALEQVSQDQSQTSDFSNNLTNNTEGIVINSDGSFNAFELRIGEKNSRNNSLLEQEPHWLVAGDQSLSVELVSGI